MSAPKEVIKGFPHPPPLDVGRMHPVTFKPGEDCPEMSSFLPRPHWEKLQNWWAEQAIRYEAWRASGDADENPLPCADDKLKNPLQIGPGAVEAINLAQTSGTSPPSLHDELPLKVSVVDNVYAGTPIERLELSWERLTKILTTPQQLRKSKQDCRLFKLVTFGDSRNTNGSLRHNENVIEIYGLVGDYDAELVTVDLASDRLKAAGVEAFIYTTASHQPDKPRWRVIAPLSKPHTPGEHAALMNKLNGALEGILANESWTLSQVFYLGRVSGVVYETRHTRGQFLDLVTISPIGKGSSRPANWKMCACW